MDLKHLNLPSTLPAKAIQQSLAKPSKGSGWLKRKEDRRAVVAHERTEKDAVRKRDKQCRWPACEFASQKPRLEVAHLENKGMGGDHGLRTTRRRLILLCFLHHQGAISLHSEDLRIDALTTRDAEGPLAFYRKDRETGDWRHVVSERAVGVSETRDGR